MEGVTSLSVETGPDWLRAIHEELRQLRESMRGLETCLHNRSPAHAARAVSVDAAQALLGCGRSQIFQLLKSGALRRAPKVGKAVMITTASLEAFQERASLAPIPPTKRRPARRTNGRGERDAILKLIRRA
jgi:predicted DNA-binding transcriptional regulator AlpA